MSLICAAMLMSTNKTVVESIPHTVSKENYQLKTDDWYFKWCMKDSDCKWMAEALYYESRSESDKGIAAVAYVIINRLEHKYWPSTVKGVITQSKQFSYRNDGSMVKGFTEKKQYVRVAVIAAKVLKREISSPVADSVYYHRYDSTPYWSKVKRKVVQIGNHVFRRE